jgi:hypothetical protein
MKGRHRRKKAKNMNKRRGKKKKKGHRRQRLVPIEGEKGCTIEKNS